MTSKDSNSFKAWAFVETTSWRCSSEGHLANTISGKLAAVQYFHRLRVGVQLSVTAAVVQWEFRGIAQAHLAAETPRRVRLPASLGMILSEGTLIPSWGSEGKRFGAVFLSELPPDGAIERIVCRRSGGDAPCAQPDKSLTWGFTPTAQSLETRDGNRPAR